MNVMFMGDSVPKWDDTFIFSDVQYKQYFSNIVHRTIIQIMPNRINCLKVLICLNVILFNPSMHW